MSSPGDRPALEARDLLEIGELRHFHAVAPALPAEPPGAERRALPVVLDEAQVVDRSDRCRSRRAIEVELLQVGRRGLEDHLVLVIVLQPVRVLAVAAVLRAARGLHIGGLPRLRPERAQRGRGVKRPGAHLHVVGLQDHAAMVGPIALQGQDQALERALRAHMGIGVGHGRASQSREERDGPYSPPHSGSSSAARRRANCGSAGSLRNSLEMRHIPATCRSAKISSLA